MRVIYKYPLQIQDRQDLALNQDADLLSIQMQGAYPGAPKAPVLWVLEDPNKPAMYVSIRCIGTGNEFNDDHQMLHHISTTQHTNGEVHHWFLELPV